MKWARPAGKLGGRSGEMLWAFTLTFATLVLVIAAVVWVGAPSSNDLLRLESPFGPESVSVGEHCTGFICSREIVYDRVTNAGHIHVSCSIGEKIPEPEFAEVAALWAADRSGVTLKFGEDGGPSRKLNLVFSRDCA